MHCGLSIRIFGKIFKNTQIHLHAIVNVIQIISFERLGKAIKDVFLFGFITTHMTKCYLH